MISYIPRIINLTSTESFFLFGPRGSGKSTFLKNEFNIQNTYWFDFLDPELEERISLNPSLFKEIINSLSPEVNIIILDEVQKIPKILGYIQQYIADNSRFRFILSGSSARKLKRGQANMLAGRAIVHYLYPYVYLELKEYFDLNVALKYGMLPKIWQINDNITRESYLRTYVHTYVKEEIIEEQIVRKLDPFRKFLEVAGQLNGKIISAKKIALDCGTSDKTVTEYYNILEDTLLGFFLEPFHTSFRKRLREKAKFYFIDVGIGRALAKIQTLDIKPQTSYYGELFEAFIITEIKKLIDIFCPDTKISYFQTAAGFEIDLVLEKPGKLPIFIEIKSAQKINSSHYENLKIIAKNYPDSELYCISLDPTKRSPFNNCYVWYWKSALEKIFQVEDFS